MTTILIWGSRLHVVDKPAGRTFRFGSVDDLLALLGQLIPKRGRLRIIYEGDFIRAERVEVPQGTATVIRQALSVSASELDQPGAAWSFETHDLPNSAPAYATVYSEALIKFHALREMLAEKYGIILESVFPLAATCRRRASASDRLQLTCLICEDGAVLAGQSGTGEPLFESVKEMSRDAMAKWIMQRTRAMGVCVQTGTALPAYVVWVELGSTPPDDPVLGAKKLLEHNNRFTRESLDGVFRSHRSSLGKRSETNMLSMEHHAIDINPVLRWGTIAAAFVAVAAHFVGMQIHRNTASALGAVVKQSREWQDDEARRSQMRLEIKNLHALYGADAGWTSAPPKDLLRIIGDTTPAAASLDFVSWNSSGSFGIRGTLWQTDHPGESDRWLESFVQNLTQELPTLQVPVDRLKMNRKTGQFSFEGRREAAL